MSSIWARFAKLMKDDNRKASRHMTSSVVAYYWDGGVPAPHPIRDISISGAFLPTDQRWRPGTIVTMTLQKSNDVAGDPHRSIAVQAKVMRLSPDGVGIKFIFPDSEKIRGENIPMGETADRKALLTFLKSIPRE